MDRKDIEDFLRRSNSICDQSDDAPVAVRRMSLKEFTGLDPSKRDQIAELSIPSWKSSTTSSSLINLYSSRRRSLLSGDVTDSPTKRLSAPKEEVLDINSALQRISALTHKISTFHRQSVPSPKGDANCRMQLLEDGKRTATVARELAQINISTEDVKLQALVAEITDAVDCLCSSALEVMANSSVYHSQLISTELQQVLTSLSDSLNDIMLSTSHEDRSICVKSLGHLTSAANQLVHAISSLS
ncbi:unnamed protein product [Auanema sp. JU1783]|nr:unnamed protein product [Auanema sp. JU1783]